MIKGLQGLCLAPDGDCLFVYFLKELFTKFFSFALLDLKSNLIFWIVMGCGEANFGQRGLKMPQTKKNWG